MSMLNSGSPKKGFPSAASNVRPKAQVGSGLINVNKLKGIQDRKRGRYESYKLNPNGLSRFRLVMPLGNDDTPMVSADTHWVPVTNDEGKVYKRPVYCYKQFGFSDCPICALQERLAAARDQAIADSADELKLVYRWAAYVINRDYLAGSDDPENDYDPKQDKVQMFVPISLKIADDIIAYLGKRTWGNASDPDNGYDFEVEGEQTGKVFNGYKVSDYTVSPVPKDCSPAYSTDILHGVKPLSEVITYLKKPDLQKILDPILLSVSKDSEEAEEIINGFTGYYNQLLEEIVTGPTEQIGDSDYDDYEKEQIQVIGDDESEQAGVDASSTGADESQGAELESKPEEEANGIGEGTEDSRQIGEDEEDIGVPFDETAEDTEAPIVHPAPQARPKPASQLPSTHPAQVAKPSATAGLLGKLKQVGKR